MNFQGYDTSNMRGVVMNYELTATPRAADIEYDAITTRDGLEGHKSTICTRTVAKIR